MKREKLFKLNKFVACFLVGSLMFNLMVTAIPLSAKTANFSSWAYGDFVKAQSLGILTELENLEPQETIKVAQFLTLTDQLYQKMTGKATVTEQLKKAVETLDAQKAITKEQAAFVIKVMLDLVEDKLSEYPATPSSFKDSASINDTYKEAVNYLIANDVINGYLDNSLKPLEAITYQQAVIFLNATYEKFEDQPKLLTSATYEGFVLTQIKDLDETSSVMYTFKHHKTGAQLVFIKNEDNNKGFCIGVKTLPKDDKGIPHIIEHSVLGGSKNFQAKDPFFTVLNGQSLYTFMNALTTDTFTAYPISTTNMQDYNNLMYLYMDAVFSPNLLKDERIFSREAIRKELTSKEAQVAYNGIVYNEMKGNYSKDSVILQSARQKALFPDTPYAYESGGKPAAIEDLTYEEFKTFYEANYHPSNALFYLYGDVDIIDRLQFIDENYLSNYEKKEYNNNVNVQEAFKQPVVIIEKYAVAEGTDVTNKYVYDVSYVVSDYGNVLETYGLSLLAEVLNAPNSPIEIALKNAGLSTNFSVRMDANSKQNTFSFVLNDASKEQQQKFKEVVANTLKSMSETGIDHASAEALLNAYELSQRMSQYSTNAGFQFGMNMMINWVNDEELDQFFEYGDMFDQLGKKVKDNYLEQLIKTYFIDNNHSATIVLQPSTTLLKDIDAASSLKLSKYQEAMSSQDIDDVVKRTKDFETYISTPDSAEVMAQLPSLSIEQLETEFVEPTVLEKTVNGARLLHAQADTSEIVQVDYLFDGTKVEEDKLQYLKLALSLLTKVDTDKYTEEELYNAIYNHSMGLSIGNAAITNNLDPKAYSPKNTISFVALEDHVDDMNAILTEVLLHSKLDNKEQILQVVSEMKTQYGMSDPLNFAVMQVQSYYSESGAYSNELAGMAYYKFLSEVEKQLIANPESVIKEIKAAYALAFPKDNLTISVVGSESGCLSVEKNLSSLMSTLPVISSSGHTYKLDPTEINEGFASASQVQYSVLGTNIKDLGFKYSGQIEVLESLLNGYLTNVLRMQNGAYGGGISIDDAGVAIMYSYRDPMLKETYATFASIPALIETTELNDYALQSYIISAYRGLTPLYDPLTAGSVAIFKKLMNNQTVKSQLIEEVLSTNVEDIKAFVPLLQKVLEKGNYCTIGNETVINENKDSFDSVKTYLGE